MHKLVSENYLKYIEPLFRVTRPLFKLTGTYVHYWLLALNNLCCDSTAPVDSN